MSISLAGEITVSGSIRAKIETIGDPYWNNVGMLVPADSAVEVKTNASVSTKFGTPVWGSIVQTKFNGSLYLDGSSSVSIDDSNVQNLGSAWTIEAWVYINTWSGGDGHVASAYISGGSNLNWAIYGSGGGDLNVLVGSGTSASFDIVSGIDLAVPIGAWHHIAATWDGTTYRGFTDGILKGSVVSSTPMGIIDSNVVLGSNPSVPFAFLNGYIDDFRITKNVARYTTNFTPPTAAFPTF